MTKGKCFLGVLGLLVFMGTPRAEALPVLNLNAPGAEHVTVFPDHADTHLYYLSPSVMLVKEDKDGKPLFSYLEYGPWRRHRAVVQAVLAPRYDDADVDEVKKSILAHDPLAKFTGIPFASSRVVFSEILAPFVEGISCVHQGGVVGDDENCSFILSPFGVAVFRKQFEQSVAVSLSLEYSVMGVAQGADGTYSQREGNYTIAGRIGGAELMKWPDLFKDAYGNRIVF